MDESHLVKLPTPGFNHPGVTSSAGVSKGNITLTLSIVAVIISLAGASVSYIRWSTGERAQAEAVAGQAQKEALVNGVLVELTKDLASHPNLRREIDKLAANLDYSPPPGTLSPVERLAFGLWVKEYALPLKERDKASADKGLAVAATFNQRQDTVKKSVETVEATGMAISAGVKGELDRQVVAPLIPSLRNSAQRGIDGDKVMLGMPASFPTRPVIGAPKPKEIPKRPDIDQ